MPTITSKPILLTSPRLAVEVAPPGLAYHGPRFDWTGFITQVTLDGVHTFCGLESLQPERRGLIGMGLCNEFGNEKPTGYADAKPGESFPKFGIGLLRRPDAGDYSYIRSYEVVQPFPVHLTSSPDLLSLVVEPLSCRGYAARLIRTMAVKDNWLEIAYRLENTGSRPIDTHEYTHNFVCLDGQRLGPDYSVRLACPVEQQDLTPSLRSVLPSRLRKIVPVFLINLLIKAMLKNGLRPLDIQGPEIGFRQAPKTWFYLRTAHFGQAVEPQWEIRLRSSGVGLREYDDFPPARVAVWGDRHVVSAEVYIDILLQPGEVKTWSRRYEFFAD